jgi:tetratricopeptide (TPR) repeat protein
MAGPKPLPTVEDIEALIEQVRHDPGAPGYVELADAYLALGRPRDAIDVAQGGLGRAPGDHAGRLALARAYAALHRWKDAQGELLAIVREDRGNRAGFALLGEVLMRRGDYERAIPVLQHAQNLDPSSAVVLGLLRAARSGTPLDAPPPLPVPIAPPHRADVRVQPAAPMPAPRMSAAAPAMGSAPATRPPPAPPVPAMPVYPMPAPSAPAMPAPTPAPPVPAAPLAPWPGAREPHAPLDADAGPTAVGGPPALRIEAEHALDRGDATVPSAPPEPWAPEPAPAQVVALPMAGGPVRPRVLPQAKPANAAAASLRQSAAVGENYLNDLLTGGLLDVPGVRVPDASWDLRAERRWGRSAVKAFVVLFVLLAIGLGGGGGWWWYSQREKARAVAAHRDKARALLAAGSHRGLTAALVELDAALRRDESNPRTFAALAEAHALRALVYGTEEKGVDTAIAGAARAIDQPEQAGFRELVIARAAIALSRLDGSDPALAALVSARDELDAFARAHPGDRWARWLQGRVLLAGGQRKAAAAAFDDAAAGADGLALAAIDRADLDVDDGKFDEAMKRYDEVLAKDADQALAIAGTALARAERGTDVGRAMDDLNVALDQDLGPRVAAYRQLAIAMGNYGLQRFVPFSEALARARGPREPRFLARVALAHVLDGKLADAAAALAQIKYYGKDRTDVDPLVALVNGAVQVAGGEDEAALDSLVGLGGMRAAALRGQALHELGRHDEAARELAAAVAAAGDNVEVKIWQQLVAAARSTAGKPREQAIAELEKTSRAATSKLGRHAHGLALLQQGDLRGARRRLEQALDNVTAEAPNPLAYRTHAALAAVARAEGDRAAETAHLDAALAANPGYLPARLARARLYVDAGDGASALPLVASVVAVRQYATAGNLVLLAEAHARGEAGDDRRAAVKAALERARAAGAPALELARVAALVDAALVEELGLAAPAEEPPASTRRRPAPRRRGR